MQKNNGNQLRFDWLTRLTRSQSNATVEKNSPLIVIVESITTLRFYIKMVSEVLD